MILTGFKFLQILNENDVAPVGCAVAIVNEHLSVYLQVEGSLNTEAEREKLKKRRDEIKK